jgi:hypothetical protein
MLREQHRLGVLSAGWCGEYLDLTGIVAGRWRKLHSEEFHSLHAYLNIVRVIKNKDEVDGTYSMLGVMRNDFKIVV